MYSLSKVAGVAASALVLLSLGVVAVSQFGPSDIELTKEEALNLMNTQTAAVMAVADRDELVNALCAKYRVSLETHSLNVATGQFVLRSKNVRSTNDGGSRPPAANDAAGNPADDAVAADAGTPLQTLSMPPPTGGLESGPQDPYGMGAASGAQPSPYTPQTGGGLQLPPIGGSSPPAPPAPTQMQQQAIQSGQDQWQQSMQSQPGGPSPTQMGMESGAAQAMQNMAAQQFGQAQQDVGQGFGAPPQGPSPTQMQQQPQQQMGQGAPGGGAMQNEFVMNLLQNLMRGGGMGQQMGGGAPMGGGGYGGMRPGGQMGGMQVSPYGGQRPMGGMPGGGGQLGGRDPQMYQQMQQQMMQQQMMQQMMRQRMMGGGAPMGGQGMQRPQQLPMPQQGPMRLPPMSQLGGGVANPAARGMRPPQPPSTPNPWENRAR